MPNSSNGWAIIVRHSQMKRHQSQEFILPAPSRPIVAIVGRPNVGKSTLFNRLTRTRRALVHDRPGVTRDRNYGLIRNGASQALLVDTGGFEPDPTQDRLQARVREQARLAIEESSLVLFVVDSTGGISPHDRDIFELLRRSEKPVFVVVNKADLRTTTPEDAYALGTEKIYAISAEHGRGTGELFEAIWESIPEWKPPETDPEKEGPLAVAIVGRPNVGKSTLINRLLGEERLVASDIAGTTRDSVDTVIDRNGRSYIFIDTAGIRRKGRIGDRLEKYSVIKALESVSRCDVACILIDCGEGLTEQDMNIAGIAAEESRGCVLVASKWDLQPKGDKERKQFEKDIRYFLKGLHYAPLVVTSSVTGEGFGDLFKAIDRVGKAYRTRIPTAQLNKVFEEIKTERSLPLHRGKRIKLNYISQVKSAPPTFVIFTNFPEGIHFSDQRWIANKIREAFEFDGVPLKIIYRAKSKREEHEGD